MVWYVSWWFSALVLIASIASCLVLWKKKIHKIKPIYVLLAGIFVAVAVIIYPIYINAFLGEPGAPLKAIMVVIQNAIQFFTADSDFTVAVEGTVGLSGWIKVAYGMLYAALLMLAPILTFGFVLSFFKETTARLRHVFHLPADSYIFSEINASSVALAESVRKKSDRDIIIFSNVPGKEDAVDDDLLSRISEIKGILYRQDIFMIGIPRWLMSRKVCFFTMCENEQESIRETLQLIQRYKKSETVEIFLFSHGIESELMLNNIDKGLLKVRRINPVRSLVNYILETEGTLLFDCAAEIADGEKEISAVIVGIGGLGKELIRGLAWYCQMDHYQLRINGFDAVADIKDQMAALCPELIDERYNGRHRHGDAYYDINIHSCNVKTESFRNMIRQIGNVTHVFVCLGDDGLNVATAVNLRVLFEQMHIHPQISAVVSDSEKNAALSDARYRDGRSYDIRFIADARTVCSVDVIINSALEKEALELHKRYNNGDPYGFYEYEYNYKSSMASVIHYEARKHCLIPGANKTEDELTQSERETIETLEHRRWNAYMRSEGFIYSGSPKKESRNDLGKMHHNLVAFDVLTDDDKRKDSRVGTK